jgi:hypothetical protein
MLMGLIVLAQLTGVKMAVDPAHQLVNAPEGYEQKTMVAQIAGAVFEGFPVGFFFITAVTALILVLAANTAFNGFPVLGSILAQDRYLPRQLHTRGDRLAFSNGIVFLAGAAIVLVIAFDAEVTKLIQLYIVGVFVSFTMSQTGMVRHWNRLLKTETDPNARRRMRRSQSINAFGLALTASVLVVVLITKFTHGAWIAIAAMAALYALMTAIRRHYDRVAEELRQQERQKLLPARNHAMVLVSKLHMPTLRALAYAKATRPDMLEAVTVNVDDGDTRRLVREWEKENFKVPLKVIESPYREITKPVLDYVKRVRTDNPRDVVTVFIPEYVVGHWWEQFLHNQSALRLKGRLLFQPGVMVTSVPWQLASSSKVTDKDDVVAPGAIRRGLDKRGQDKDGKCRRPGSGRPRRALRGPVRGPRRVRPARAARRAGGRADHRGHRRLVLPRRRRRGAGGVTGPRAGAVPVRRSRPLRRLRLAARVVAGPARAEGRGGQRAAAPPGQARLGGHRRGPARRPGGLAHPDAHGRRPGRPPRLPRPPQPPGRPRGRLRDRRPRRPGRRGRPHVAAEVRAGRHPRRGRPVRWPCRCLAAGGRGRGRGGLGG